MLHYILLPVTQVCNTVIVILAVPANTVFFFDKQLQREMPANSSVWGPHFQRNEGSQTMANPSPPKKKETLHANFNSFRIHKGPTGIQTEIYLYIWRSI